MNNNFNELRQQSTLAPLEETYKTKYMPTKDANIMSSLSQSSIVALEQAMGTVTHLLSNLKVFKECFIENINLQAEKTDITTRYAKEPPRQSHTLPGVVSMPEPYDLQAIRTDNERIMEISDRIEKTQAQKDIYLKLSKEDVRLFLSAWNRLIYSNAAIDQFMESMN